MRHRELSIVFTPGKIGNVAIKNRLIRSATFEHAATYDGKVSEELINIHQTLAKGGVGLIITGISWLNPKQEAPPYMVRVDDDSFVPGLKKLTDSIREASSDCKVMIQLHHPGRQAINQEDLQRVLASCPTLVQNRYKINAQSSKQENSHHYIEPVAPSALYDPFFDRTPRALELKEIDDLINNYADAISRSEKAGFDGVQLHAAHGWLLSSFLSPATNHRTDEYGGSTENRTRIVTDIYQRARKKVGDDYPILIKFNGTDFLSDGIDINEAIKIASIFSNTGYAALEVSGGMWEATTRPENELGWPPVLLPESRTKIRNASQEAYFMPLAKAIKEHTNTTVISVGGYRSFGTIEMAMESGNADFVSLSRPFIRQPDLPNIWKDYDKSEKAECVSCNACLPIGQTDPVICHAKATRAATE